MRYGSSGYFFIVLYLFLK
ncbi:hypothetical protein [uncultured Bacteroides sp.]